MTTATEGSPATLEFERLAATIGAALKGELPLLASAAGLMAVVDTIAQTVLTQAFDDQVFAWDSGTPPSAAYWFATLLALGVTCVCVGVVVRGVFDRLGGEPASLSELIQAGAENALALALAMIVYVLAVGSGLLLLVAPGLLVLGGWAMLLPATVIEHLSLREAIHRSLALTRDSRGFVTGVMMAMAIALAAINHFGGLLVPASETLQIGPYGLFALIEAVALLASAVVVTAVYFELRGRPMANPEQVTRVFD